MLELPEVATLSLLVTVAETGSLRQAAGLHGISQPAVSQRLRGLERRLGLRLLERSTVGSTLTPAGAAVVDWARPVLEASRELALGVAALRAEQAGQLRLAASMTVAEYLVPGWLARLHAAEPDLDVALRVGNSEQVAAMVRDRRADLGFVEGTSVPTGLRSRTVGADELLVVVAPGHRWARRTTGVRPDELAAARLVLREEGSGTRDVFVRRLAAAGHRVHAGLELGSTTAIKAAVMAGEGPGVLSALAVGAELADGRLAAVAVRDLRFERRFRAVWLPGRDPSGPAARLLAVSTATSSPGRRPRRAPTRRGA